MDVRVTLERVLWTFLQAFLGALTSGPIAEAVFGATFSVDALQAALIAGISAVLVLLKDIAVRRLSVLNDRLPQAQVERSAAEWRRQAYPPHDSNAS